MSNFSNSSFNIDAYMGLWFNFAHYPFIYQKNCLYSTANYDLNTLNNTINVNNTCYFDNSTSYSNKGIAWFDENNSNNSHINLKLQFDNSNYISDYLILWTDYKNFSIVGSPLKNNLWFLSRSKFISSDDLEKLCVISRLYGYDTDKLIISLNLIK